MHHRDSHIEKYDKMIKKLMESLKNPWIPCPKINMVEEEERIEKINEKIPLNTVELDFESTNFENNAAHLLVNLGNFYFIAFSDLKYILFVEKYFKLF